jgi:hypothetical protein
MRILLLTIVITASFASGPVVAQDPTEQALAQSVCSGTPKQVTIHYGDSEIRVTPPVIQAYNQNNNKNYLRFKLNTSPRDTDEFVLGDALVNIEGKGKDDDWIDAKGTANDNAYLDVCIEDSQAGGTYRYYVEIENVGKIDPRAIVVK